MDAWVAAICFNTVEAQKKNLPKPTSWKDLTKPVYKGTVVMPNPASSGTGFLDVSSWLQLFGETEGWKYMDALHQDRKSTRLNSSHLGISYAVFCLKKKKR